MSRGFLTNELGGNSRPFISAKTRLEYKGERLPVQEAFPLNKGPIPPTSALRAPTQSDSNGLDDISVWILWHFNIFTPPDKLAREADSGGSFWLFGSAHDNALRQRR